MKSSILNLIVLVCAAGLACSAEPNPLSTDSKEAFTAIERFKANGDYKALLLAVEKSRNYKVSLVSIRAMKDCDAEANTSLVDMLEKAASDEMLIGNLESMYVRSEKILALSEVIAYNLRIPRPKMEPRQLSHQGRILLPPVFAEETVEGFVRSARQKLVENRGGRSRGSQSNTANLNPSTPAHQPLLNPSGVIAALAAVVFGMLWMFLKRR
jgi:hypothetical protein